MRFVCYEVDNEERDDARAIEAYDMEEAAAKYAEQFEIESAEYGHTHVIGACGVTESFERGRDRWRTFRVTAESRIVYRAEMISGA